jgi:hypothetical protein
MKIGDMVRMTDDPTNICGVGFVISTVGSREVDVFWLDDGTVDRIWNANMVFAQDGTWKSYLEWHRETH